VYVEVNYASNNLAALNGLLDALGLGTPIVYDPVLPVGATTQLAVDELLEGVNEITLYNLLYRLGLIPTNADWLFKLPDGSADKAFKVNVGAGRLIVVADALYSSQPATPGNAQFGANAFEWLAGLGFDLVFPVASATVPALTVQEIPFQFSAVGMSNGTYSVLRTATVLGSPATFEVTVEVVDPEISNVVKLYTDPEASTVKWQTNAAQPCRFRYRDYGTTSWSAPIDLIPNVDHQVVVPTVANHRYDGLIEMMSNGVVLADSLIGLKTPTDYPQTAPGADAGSIPMATRFDRAVPNPFNPATELHFELAKAQRVQLDIFDVRGQRVRTVFDETRAAGRHAVVWDGQDDTGQPVGSGVYFVRMRGADYQNVGKLTLLK
jgi:hypothetical protein